MGLSANSAFIKIAAKIGLFAKGIVYCLIGLFAFMSAFHIDGHSAKDSDKTGIIQNLLAQPFGRIVLLLISVGLLCYSIWRFLQSTLDTSHKGKDARGMGKRFSYFFSGAAYLSISFLAAKAFFKNKSDDGGNSYSSLSQKLIDSPGGEWLLTIVALVLVGIGLYQVWYGLKEKHRKHIDLQSLDERVSGYLLRAGKVGYISRGIVWLIIAFLFFRAASHHNPSEAGDTGTAFNFIQHGPYGAYLLALLAIGLVCYGATNFMRAFFERAF